MTEELVAMVGGESPVEADLDVWDRVMEVNLRVDPRLGVPARPSGTTSTAPFAHHLLVRRRRPS